MTKPCAVYRIFDAAGALLYVGVSAQPLVRMEEHVRGKAWARDVAQIRLQWMPCRDTALAAERQAIRAEHPRHNRQHTTKTAYPRDSFSGTAPHADLLAEIAKFCAATGTTKTGFGVAALKDPRLVSDMEAGRELRRSSVERIRATLGAA